MTTVNRHTVLNAISEMKEFAGFAQNEQDYISTKISDVFNAESTQWILHSQLTTLETKIETLYAFTKTQNDDLETVFYGSLAMCTNLDLQSNNLNSFASYRFLYERLLGPEVRQWLPPAYVCAASMPNLDPCVRKKLLTNISEAAATAHGWSKKEPEFITKPSHLII